MTTSSFSFDHTFSRRISKTQYLRLGEMGFEVKDYVVEHEGTQLCRFIRFENGYLEFIEIADEPKFQQSLAVDGEIDRPCGFSLKSNGPLKPVFEEFQNNLHDFQPHFSHKNYDWKNDNTSDLPGWNFLSFRKPIVQDIEIWFTENEPRPEKFLRNHLPTRHRNSVQKILGLVWNIVQPQEIADIEKIMNATFHNRALTFENGPTLWLAIDEDFLVFSQKTSSYLAVVLQAENLSLFQTQAPAACEVPWRGNAGYLISQHSQAFDILVV